MNDAVSQIERDRQRRERELTLLMLLLMAQVRRYATHAIRLGSDPLAAMQKVWLGGEHFRGITSPLARAMADAHIGGFRRAARLSESPDGLPDANVLASIYEPIAQTAATQMLGTMQQVVADAINDNLSKPASVRVKPRTMMVEAFDKGGYAIYKGDPWTIRRAATANILPAYSNGMAQGFRNGLHTGYVHESIIDDGTTEICSERDGLLLKRDDFYWLYNWPPLHFGCRSIVLPVRGPQVWSENYPALAPEEGWGRMPTWLGSIEVYPRAA